MEVDSRSGLVQGVPYAASPNCDARPKQARAELIVVHGISLPPGEFGGEAIGQLFTNALDCTAHPFYKHLRGVRVSAHVLIRRPGDMVQFVPFHRRAWHAGESEYRGRANCNDFSIGIELEGTDEAGYAECQMEALAVLIAALEAAYPWLGGAPVVGHSDIAPGRKTDPGRSFDWARLEALRRAARIRTAPAAAEPPS